MRKLLSANTNCLLKNRIFYLEMIFCALFSAWIVFMNYNPEIQTTKDCLSLDDVFFTMYQLLCLVLAACISLTIGTEYSDGTIRNKLIVGHTRFQIYFSMLLTNIFSTILILVIHGIVTYVLGYFLLGAFQMKISQLIIALLCAILTMLVFTAFFAAIALNCSNKAITVVGSFFAALAIIYMSSFAGNKLLEPEMTYDGIVINMDGVQFGDLIENPAYVTGTARTVFEFVYDLLPAGQIMQINSMDFTRWSHWPVLSILLFVLITVVGFKIFEKKDIK